MKKSIVLFLSVFFLATACGVVDDDTNDTVETQEQALFGSGGGGGGFPGVIPPRGETKCGDAICENGDVCCNVSCGVCAGPGESCTQEICNPTF